MWWYPIVVGRVKKYVVFQINLVGVGGLRNESGYFNHKASTRVYMP